MIRKNAIINRLWDRKSMICLFLVLMTFAVYWQVRNHEFIGYDDDGYVTENPRVQNGLTLKNIIWAFKSTHKSNWHPLTWLSHMLDVQLFGMNPGRHHMTSVLFHMLNSLLLFAVFNRMTGKLWQSGFVAAMFALHPLHVESVAWVAERKDVLSTFFGMLTLWSYARYAERPDMNRYLPVIGFFVLSLMAKPMLVTLPFVLLLLDYWPLRRAKIRSTDDDARNLQPRPLVFLLIWEKTPLFFLSLASCFATFFVQKIGGAIGTFDTHPFFVRVSNTLVSYTKYIQKMIWPDNLAVLYPYPTSIYWWQITGAFVLLAAITFLAIRYLRKLPWFAVGWFWYMGTLIPVIGLVQVGVQARADRYTYFPLIGLFIIVAWGFPQLVDKWRHKTKLVFTILTTLFPILIATSWIQARYWQNSITLFRRTLDVTSANFVIQNNLGFELALQGRTDDAIKHYKEALSINPDFEMAYINLGKALLSQGKLDKSVNYYRALLAVKPNYTGIHHNLGIILLRKGEIDNAIFHFREALRIRYDYVEVYNSLGAAMTAKGELKKAIMYFKEALRIKPDFYEAKRNLNKLENKMALKPKVTLDFK